MAEDTKKKFVDRVPELTNKKWGGMRPGDAETLMDDILKAGPPAVQQLVMSLQEVDNGSDWKERFLIHSLVTHVCDPGRRGKRKQVAEGLLESATGDCLPPVQAFVLQQARLVVDASSIKRVAAFLESDVVEVIDAAAACLVTIGAAAKPFLEKAVRTAKGHKQIAVEHALRQIS